MRTLDFRDEYGRLWRISEEERPLPSGLLERWLTFESEREVRRLAPVPIAWVQRSPAELSVFLRWAEPCRAAPDLPSPVHRP